MELNPGSVSLEQLLALFGVLGLEITVGSKNPAKRSTAQAPDAGHPSARHVANEQPAPEWWRVYRTCRRFPSGPTASASTVRPCATASRAAPGHARRSPSTSCRPSAAIAWAPSSCWAKTTVRRMSIASRGASRSRKRMSLAATVNSAAGRLAIGLCVRRARCGSGRLAWEATRRMNRAAKPHRARCCSQRGFMQAAKYFICSAARRRAGCASPRRRSPRGGIEGVARHRVARDADVHQRVRREGIASATSPPQMK